MTENVGEGEKNSLTLMRRQSERSLGEESVRSSTSLLYRIQRRPEERSVSRRSKRSEEKDPEAILLSKFYVKGGVGLDCQASVGRRESKLVTANETKQAKHRSPTPLPGYRRSGKRQNKDSTMDISMQLQIADLQRKVQDQRTRKLAAEKRACVFEKELREKLRIVQQLQQRLNVGKVDQSKSVSAMASEQGQSFSNLQKLKRNMAHARISELQEQVASLIRQNGELRGQIQRLRRENEAFGDEVEILRNQICLLNQKSGQALVQSQQRQIQLLRQRISESASERQAHLDHFLTLSERDKQSLRSRITNLQMKIAFINRKKNQEIELVTSRKDKDLADHRRKLSLLVRQLMQLKQQVKLSKGRPSMLSKGVHGHRELQVSLSLSPDF